MFSIIKHIIYSIIFYPPIMEKKCTVICHNCHKWMCLARVHF